MIVDKDVALANPQSYPGWCSALKSDKDCMLAAVHFNGSALWQASDDLRTDREVVLAAVRQAGHALRYASANLRADYEIVLAAVQNSGYALSFASNSMRANREIIFEAMRTNGNALYFADPELKKDSEYIGILADAYPLGDIWCRNRPITTANLAHKAMRSKRGLLTLATQSRTSILGNPIILRDFLVSAVELGCLTDIMAEIEKNQKKGIVDALRTVMTWYGVDTLSPDIDDLDAFCTMLSEAFVAKN